MKFTKYNTQVPFIIEKDGIIIDLNPALIELSGFIKEDLINHPFNKVWYELLRITVQPRSTGLKQEAFLFTKALSVRCINISASKNLLTSETKYIISEIPNSRFEERNLYLMQLSKSDLVGVAVYSVPNMILLKANEKYLGFLQPPFNKEAISIGRRIEEIIPKWKGSPVEGFWKEAMCTGRVVSVNEYEHIGYKRGITYWDSIITPIPEENRIKYVVSNTYEVTERVINRKKVKEQMAEINLKNKQLEAIFESIQDNISVFDKQGRYLKKSSSSGKLFQPTDNNVWTVTANNNFFDLEGRALPKEELCHSKLMKHQNVKNLKVKMTTNREEKYLDVSGVPILNEDNQFEMGVMFNIDITETINLTKNQKILEQTQRQLLQAERERNETLENAIEMKDDFLSLISHELRTPLNVINSAVQALNYICADELSDKAKKYLGMIKQNTHRQLRLVNNLLDITRDKANRINLHKKNIDIVFLSKAILDSVHTYACQKGINLVFESSLDYKIIGIDDEKYERILLNLLSNAIKFTPEGKSIKVKLRTVKSSICIEVKDDGIGIPADKINIIFEKFGQVDSLISRQAEGAGIGLSLVKRFVEVLGGSISVKSTVGLGSIFTILLPCEKISDEQSENPSGDFMNNRLVEISTVEFSDIYL